MVPWMKSLLRRIVALFRGWLDNGPSVHRSLSAAATPPEFDPCQDPFGDNLDEKVNAFEAALTAMQIAAEEYLNCRLQHQSAQVSIEFMQQKFAGIATLKNEILESLA